jgi:histidinol dehydrogenase
MPRKFDEILISYKQQDFASRLSQVRISIMQQAWFMHGDDRLSKVLEIIRKVKAEGADAVSEFTEQFDGVKLSPEEFRIGDWELDKAHDQIDRELLKSIRRAIENVKQYQCGIFTAPSGVLRSNINHPGIKYTPIESVGVCVPGASAPLPSTVVMTVVPAQVAGVRRIAVVSPPRYEGSIHPVILAVCKELGVDEVYRIGGVQAVAALAFGAGKTILKVDKIVGPGNQWVQTAKREVFGVVGIDSVAGPSEVLIVANEKANPSWIAADMLSQAEHDPGCAVVFTDSEKLAGDVLDELEKQVEKLPRSEQTIKCLKEYSIIAVFDSFEDVISRANDFAAEHLEIQCGGQSREIAEKINNAGAVFIGDYSPVAVGDYWAGPSHTLPTGMTAKFFSALSANDFIKSTSIIEYDKKMLTESAADIIRLAETEGLDAHARSIKIRQQD